MTAAFGIAAAAAIGLWLLLLIGMAIATKTPGIDPAPPTAELGPESPAVVDLITGDWKLTDEAVSATLLDLAARDVVAIEEIGPELSLIRLNDPPSPLTPYEQLVYEHVQRLARDGVVATGALAEGRRNLGGWWRRFKGAVMDEARGAGLSRLRLSRYQVSLLSGAMAVPAILAGAAAAVADEEDRFRAAIAAGLGVIVVLSAFAKLLNGEVGTREGARAAGRWLGVREHLAANARFADSPAAAVTIWGRHLAYGAALGLTPHAVASLPVSRPADNRRAWSDYGGMWHVVHVHYPGRTRGFQWRPWMWGRTPQRVLIASLLSGLIAAFSVSFPARIILPEAGDVLVGLVLVAIAVPVYRALTDLATKATVEGQVVRLRRFQHGEDSNDKPKYSWWVAIDDGRKRRTKAFGIGRESYDALCEGDIVRAELAARVGWVHRITVLTPSRHR